MTTKAATTAQMTDEQVAELKALLTPELVSQYPDIIQLLFQTPSLEFSEKKYWLELLPFMSDEHVERLRTILVTERQKMNALESKYEEALGGLGAAKRMTREESEKRHKTIKHQEELSQQEEEHLEQNILNQLGEI